LPSNGKVRGVDHRNDVRVERPLTHLTYPMLRMGPLPLPPTPRLVPSRYMGGEDL